MGDKPTVNATFPTEAALYKAYMPFIRGGGLFIRSTHVYALGDTVSLVIQFLNEPEPYVMEGKVVWITPRGAQGSKAPGCGFQFIGDKSRQFSQKIETTIAGMLKSAQMTDTL